MSAGPAKPPNDCVIWFQEKSNERFRKYTIAAAVGSGEETKIALTPISFSLFRGKLSLDLSKYLIQMVPSVRVTVRGRSRSTSTFSKSGSLSSSPSGAPPSPDVKTIQKSEEDRFHHAESYISLLPIGGTDAERFTLRARDSHEAELWFRFFLRISRRKQSEEECYPYGNPNPDAQETKSEAASTKNEKKGTVDADGGGHTTSSNATSSESDETQGSTSRRTKKASQTKRVRASSSTFDDIPLVKATSAASMKDKKKKKSSPTDEALTEGFTVVIEEASSDDESSPQLMRKSQSMKHTVVTSGAPRSHRWLQCNETTFDDDANDPREEKQRRRFLEHLWERCQNPDDELVHKEKERMPLESEFAAATITTTVASRNGGNTGAYLFDQADNRTTASCKAAAVRNGLPVTLVSMRDASQQGPTANVSGLGHPTTSSLSGAASPSISAATELANELGKKCPLLSLLHFDNHAVRIDLVSGERLVVSYKDIVSVVPEESSVPIDGASNSDDNTTSSMSTLSSSRRSSSVSSKILRRLSPTPSNTSLNNETAKVLFTDLTSPTSNINQAPQQPEALTLVLPNREDAGSLPSFPYYLHLFFACRDWRETTYASPVRQRQSIFPLGLLEAVIGFEFAVERKAVQRILAEYHAKEMMCVSDVVNESLSSTANTSVITSSTTIDGVPRTSNGNYYGVYDERLDVSSSSAASSNRTASSAWRDSIIGSRQVDLGKGCSQLVSATQRDMVLDCLAYDMVQMYLNSARRTF